MAKPAETLDGDDGAGDDAHSAHAIEDGDAGAKERGVGCGVYVGRDRNGGFDAEVGVFGV